MVQDNNQFSNRRTLLKSAGVGSAVALAGCLGSLPSGGQGLTTVHVGENRGNGIQSATAMIAEQKGWAEEKGIKFKPKTYGIGIDIMRGIAAQEVDFGVDGASWAFINTASKGQDIAFPSQLWTFDPMALITPKDIQEPKDLEGERVGRIEGSIMDYITFTFFDNNDIAEEDVELVNMNSASDQLAALQNGDIKGAWLWTRFMEEALKVENLHDLTYVDFVTPLTVDSWGVYTMRKSWAENNKDTAAKCLELVDRATDWLENNVEASAELVADEWDLPQDEVERTNRMLEHYTGIYGEHVDHFKSMHQFGVERGLMDDFDLDDHVLYDVAERAEGIPVEETAPDNLGSDLEGKDY